MALMVVQAAEEPEVLVDLERRRGQELREPAVRRALAAEAAVVVVVDLQVDLVAEEVVEVQERNVRVEEIFFESVMTALMLSQDLDVPRRLYLCS